MNNEMWHEKVVVNKELENMFEKSNSRIVSMNFFTKIENQDQLQIPSVPELVRSKRHPIRIKEYYDLGSTRVWFIRKDIRIVYGILIDSNLQLVLKLSWLLDAS